ncbi:MAG: arginine--tRNA ligase [Spirochaetia bacterium]|nr:arginine--tRNA ligase [Spirochaetia bacterium]
MLDDFLKEEITRVIAEKYGSTAAGVGFAIEPPPANQPGHFGTNAALTISKILKQNPFVIGEEMAFCLRSKEYAQAVDVIKPGYVNITLKNRVFKKELALLLETDNYFRNNSGAGINVNLEFVSANPVGPLNIVSGRAAAYGDTLANLMKYSGYNVTKETYVNDFGRQMHLFALSLMARYLQSKGMDIPMPEDGYQGEYVRDIAAAFDAYKGPDYFKKMGTVKDPATHNEYKEFRAFGLDYVLKMQKKTLERFGVKFDGWFSETSLHTGGDVEEAFEEIRSRGLFYEKEDAVWFRTTDFGDDKDRVVKKTDGDYTYFASDIAYINNKLKRGADLIINILGPDHHGYVKRLESIIQGLKGRGYNEHHLKVIILQQVNLLESGEKMKMSKREGKFVTLDELMDNAGRDASRWFFVMRNYNSHLDFDLTLAKEQSDKNPVFYVQYAYARICSVFEKAKESVKSENEYGADGVCFDKLEQEETDLVRAILHMPYAIRDAADKFAPSVLTQAVFDLCGVFHHFYAKHRVVQEDRNAMLKRLFILSALKKTLKECFDIIGINAPEKM